MKLRYKRARPSCANNWASLSKPLIRKISSMNTVLPKRARKPRTWTEDERIKHRLIVNAHYYRNREKRIAQTTAWARANPEKARAKVKRWFQRNPEYHAATRAKRHARKLQCSPSWLTADDLQAVWDFYAEAKLWTQLTGIEHCVDHICPMQGDGICGLHVPWNLGVLSRSENAKKHNRWVEADCLPAFV